MIAALFLTQAATQSQIEKYVYPMAPTKVCPPIEIDVTEAPDLKPWAEQAKIVATEWFPRICELLATEDYKVPAKIKFEFKKDIGPPAYASGNTLTFKVDWIRQRPEDMGIVVHELTHIIQSYPRNKVDTGWLVEGLADYIRWWRYEPEAPRSRINFEKASYRDAYRTTAAFLAWLQHKYDKRLVPALDRNLRKAEDPMPTFKSMTGKTADELWGEFKAESSK